MLRRAFEAGRPFFVLLIATVAMNVLLWAGAFILFDRRNPAAILHYSADVGIDFIGEGSKILALPIVGSMILFLNTILGLSLFRLEPRLAWGLWAGMPLAQVFLLISFALLRAANN